jgi:hypothetical protein
MRRAPDLRDHAYAPRGLRRESAANWVGNVSDQMAAGYCDERSAEAFLSRVGTEYPEPVVKAGRRQLWLKDDLDRAIKVGRATLVDVGGGA